MLHFLKVLHSVHKKLSNSVKQKRIYKKFSNLHFLTTNFLRTWTETLMIEFCYLLELKTWIMLLWSYFYFCCCFVYFLKYKIATEKKSSSLSEIYFEIYRKLIHSITKLIKKSTKIVETHKNMTEHFLFHSLINSLLV